MKTVVFRSPFLIEGEFPDARVTLQRDVPTPVTDEQAKILLTNPDVSLVADAPAPAKASADKAPSAPAAASASASSEVK